MLNIPQQLDLFPELIPYDLGWTPQFEITRIPPGQRYVYIAYRPIQETIQKDTGWTL